MLTHQITLSVPLKSVSHVLAVLGRELTVPWYHLFLEQDEEAILLQVVSTPANLDVISRVAREAVPGVRDTDRNVAVVPLDRIGGPLARAGAEQVFMSSSLRAAALASTGAWRDVVARVDALGADLAAMSALLPGSAGRRRMILGHMAWQTGGIPSVARYLPMRARRWSDEEPGTVSMALASHLREMSAEPTVPVVASHLHWHANRLGISGSLEASMFAVLADYQKDVPPCFSVAHP